MKNNKTKKTFSKLLVTTFIGMALYIAPVNALNIKESVDTDIENGSYVIGITRFTPDQIMTAARVSKATANDMIYNANTPDYEGADIYYYLFGTWYKIDENNQYNEVTNTTELATLNTRDIFYVNNVEKKISINYRMSNQSAALTYDTIPSTKAKYVEYVNGVITVPSTISNIKVLENGTEMQTYNRVDGTESVYNPVNLGSIGRDDKNTGGALNVTSTSNSLTFDGNIAWYGKNANRTTPGNMIGFKFTAPAGYTVTDLANTTVKLNGEVIAWRDKSDKESLELTTIIDRVDSTNGNTFDIEVTWAPGVVQNFQVKVTNTSTLAPAELGTISTTNGSLTGDTLTITGEVAWNGKKQVTISAPNVYSASTLTATKVIVDGKEYAWSEIASGTTANVELLLKENKTPTIKVVWNEENEQEFKIDATSITYAEMPKGDIFGNDPNTTSTKKGNTITFTGNDIPYNVFAGDKGGNQIKVRLQNTAYDYTNGKTFKAIINDYLGETTVENLDNVNNSVMVTFTKDFREATIQVVWEDGNIQDFNVEVGDYATFMDVPYGTINHNRTNKYGDADWDNFSEEAQENMVGLLSNNTYIKDTIIFYGDISYWRAENGLKAGNRVAVKIEPNAYFQDKLSGISVKYINEAGVEVTEPWGNETSYTYTPLVSKDKPVTIEVIWATEGNKSFSQVFTIKVKNEDIPGVKYDAILYSAPSAKLTPIENSDYTTAVDGNKVTITGNVPYSKATDAIQAGSLVRVGLSLDGMYYTDAEIKAAKVVETVGNEEVYNGTFENWNKYSNTWIVALNNSKTAKLEITWEDGNVQTIELDATSATVEAAPRATITTRANDDYSAVINGNDITITGKVPYITEGGATGNLVYVKVDPSSMTAYTEDEIAAAKVSLKAGTNEVNDITWNDFKALNEGAWLVPFVYGVNTATMTIAWENGNTQVITITVAPDAILETKAENIEIDDIDVTIGEPYTIMPTLTPDYATNSIEYTILTETTAITIENGVITANEYSSTPISVQAQIDDLTITFNVNTVYKDIEIKNVDVTTTDTTGVKITLLTPQIEGGSGNFKYTLLKGIDVIATSNDGNPISVTSIEEGTYTIRVEDKISGAIKDTSVTI